MSATLTSLQGAKATSRTQCWAKSWRIMITRFVQNKTSFLPAWCQTGWTWSTSTWWSPAWWPTGWPDWWTQVCCCWSSSPGPATWKKFKLFYIFWETYSYLLHFLSGCFHLLFSLSFWCWGFIHLTFWPNSQTQRFEATLNFNLLYEDYCQHWDKTENLKRLIMCQAELSEDEYLIRKPWSWHRPVKLGGRGGGRASVTQPALLVFLSFHSLLVYMEPIFAVLFVTQSAEEDKYCY